MDHEGMSHAGRVGGGAEKNKEKILFFVCVLGPVVVVSFLLRQRVVARQTVGSCLACVRVKAFGSFLL